MQAVDGLIITGATGTNVNDVAVVLIGGEEQADAGNSVCLAPIMLDPALPALPGQAGFFVENT